MSDSTIHPTAIIHPDAVLGSGCEIGPYCIIGPTVRLGDACRLLSHVVIDGDTQLGDGCEVHPFACLGGKTQDKKFTGGAPAVRIGKRNVIREYVTINAATADGDATTVGDDCLIQSYCHIAHDCHLGNRVIMSSGAMLSGHILVGDSAIIGGMCGIVQFVRIGTGAMVGGMSKLGADVLPFCIAEGAPAVTRTVNKIGMERNGRSDEAVKAVRVAYKRFFREGLRVEEAIASLQAEFPHLPEIAEITAFAAGGKVGLARPLRTTT